MSHELFTIADLNALPKPQRGVGSPVTLPGGSRGWIVAPVLDTASQRGWWLVKLNGGVVVRADGSHLLDS